MRLAARRPRGALPTSVSMGREMPTMDAFVLDAAQALVCRFRRHSACANS